MACDASGGPRGWRAPRTLRLESPPNKPTHPTADTNYEDKDDERLEREIHKRWTVFTNNDLPKFLEKLRAERWIWEGAEHQ